ncbi:hypothetical protein AB0B51_02460 [Streptomyces griseus]|uniref:hypothetical protein n=1 Tax=Streptomyces griseus TaxID=1911 RepID=UPI0004CACFA6|nr:hypothetical protein [Streptomyces griseus]
METKGGDGVEFVYRVTADEFEEALRAWALRTGAGRFQAFAVPVASAGAPAVFGVVVGLSAPVVFGALVVCAGRRVLGRPADPARPGPQDGQHRGAVPAVLPERGAKGPEGVERLRAVPGRNLRRLERWPRPVAR